MKCCFLFVMWLETAGVLAEHIISLLGSLLEGRDIEEQAVEQMLNQLYNDPELYRPVDLEECIDSAAGSNVRTRCTAVSVGKGMDVVQNQHEYIGLSVRSSIKDCLLSR
jgi:hypothetical protein